MKILLSALGVGVLVYVATFVSVIPYFSKPKPPPMDDQCTMVIHGETRPIDRLACECDDPCSYCECRSGVCTVIYTYPDQTLHEQGYYDTFGNVFLEISMGGCRPQRQPIAVSIHCTGNGYDSRTTETAIVGPEEKASIALPDQWFTRIDSEIDCSVTYDTKDETNTLRMYGPYFANECAEYSIDPETGALVEDVYRYDGLPCYPDMVELSLEAFRATLVTGHCQAGTCVMEI